MRKKRLGWENEAEKKKKENSANISLRDIRQSARRGAIKASQSWWEGGERLANVHPLLVGARILASRALCHAKNAFFSSRPTTGSGNFCALPSVFATLLASSSCFLKDYEILIREDKKFVLMPFSYFLSPFSLLALEKYFLRHCVSHSLASFRNDAAFPFP
jgi:hypothetical protein